MHEHAYHVRSSMLCIFFIYFRSLLKMSLEKTRQSTHLIVYGTIATSVTSVGSIASTSFSQRSVDSVLLLPGVVSLAG